MATTFSTLEALEALCKSVPDWNARLDELNGQIANRQLELARLTEQERPPTRSLKNKGSTESLRPKDGNENPFLSEPENGEDIQMNPFDSPKSQQNGSARNRPSSPAAARKAAMASPPPKASSNPRPSPTAGLTRQSSQPVHPTQPRQTHGVLRKRKTESLASAESHVPNYRTRSMIIVYYDSAVQTAFEDLVKFVSGSRNAMRKGKMAAKMAEMRRAAELEVDAEDDDEEEEDGAFGDLVKSNGILAAGYKHSNGSAPANFMAADTNGGDAEPALPKLKYMSTRGMGPLRDFSPRPAMSGGGLSVGLLRGYRRTGSDSTPDIFDELDKGLEWCQGQCEHAAHQFLRDGDCSTEIANIKRKLNEVKISAQKEVEKLHQAEKDNPTPTPKPDLEEDGRARVEKTPLVRKELNMGNMKDLEVDDSMEVDEEEMEMPPKMIFKRSRDIGV